MKIKLNPTTIFADYAMIGNKAKKNHLHIVNHWKNLVYKASKSTLPYFDHFETSNQKASLILSYGGDENGIFSHMYHVVFPTFRKKINDTRGSFSVNITNPILFTVNQKVIEQEQFKKVLIDGMIHIQTSFDDLLIQRDFICCETPTCLTRIKIKNQSLENKRIVLSTFKESYLVSKDEVANLPYHIDIFLHDEKKQSHQLDILLKAKEEKMIYLSISCAYEHQKENIDCLKAFQLRKKQLKEIQKTYQVEIEDSVIASMAKLSKVRAFESIFKTKNGFMHSPGGGQYYAAMWCNDQCEYALPFFSYNSIQNALKATNNCFMMYQKYMFTDQALVSSIIAEGDDYWNGAKDRGDGAMYLYGVCYYLLIQGNTSLALKYVDAIKWCIEFSLSRKNQDGLIQSDSDELENRFESGKCNLATNCIFYAGLVYANRLFNQLHIANHYDLLAKELKEKINTYFYHNGQCLYCKEETHLRAHAVYPLIMGIYDHVDDIIKTIMNPLLFSENGFKTIDCCETYWDRITLMAIRGLFNANQADLAYDLLKQYSDRRMLNNHVPYAIEAYPEGNQAHLSAESALYERIFLEGILGFKPYSFHAFELHLSMPLKCHELKINHFTYHQQDLSIVIKQISESKYELRIPQLHYQTIVDNHKDIIIQIQ